MYVLKPYPPVTDTADIILSARYDLKPSFLSSIVGLDLGISFICKYDFFITFV